MENFEKPLAACPIFRGLSPGQIQTLARCARAAHFESNEFVFKEGEDSKGFFLIQSGVVAIETFSPTHQNLTLQTLREGELLGWSWLVPPYRTRFAARAVEPVDVIALDGARVREACDRDHDLGYELLKRFISLMSFRLHAARLQLLDLYGVPARRS
jgi:CRP/FNR family cyclic AMP-dependent transcriptional regulator